MVKKPGGAATIEEYFAQIDERRKSEMLALHRLIMKAVPKLKPAMVAGMIGYGKYHYKYSSGREGDWYVVGLASQKNYISVYVCATIDGKYVAESHKDELPKASIGRSCIRFKRTADIDLKVLTKLIKVGAKAMAKDLVNNEYVTGNTPAARTSSRAKSR